MLNSLRLDIAHVRSPLNAALEVLEFFINGSSSFRHIESFVYLASFCGRVALAFSGLKFVLWQIVQLSGSPFSDSEPAKFRFLDSMQHSKFHRIGVFTFVNIGSVEHRKGSEVLDFKFSVKLRCSQHWWQEVNLRTSG